MNFTINRRDFLIKGGLGMLTLASLPAIVRKSVASDRLRIAHIGVGGMGNQHMQWFAALPDVEVAALCDVDEAHLAASLLSMKNLQPGVKVDGYGDFRHILDRNDIDAITCATPDHWHAQIAIMAFQAGKDVYGEKPLSYDVNEGKLMLKNLKKYNRIFQLGTQIHAGDNYHRVAELIRSGVIGKVHTARIWKNEFSPGLGHPVKTDPPKTLNWDMWLGPAPYTDYFPERCHSSYRYFLDYSGGVYADFWCHIADIVFWALEPTGLKRINARGETTGEIADVPKWIDVDFEYEGLKIFWTTLPPDVPGAGERGIGAWFEGTKGTLICDYETMEITIDEKSYSDIPEIEMQIPRSPGHQQNFIDAVKSRKQPESNLEYVRKMALPMHLGLISWRLGRPLEWDDKKEKFINDREADLLLSRKYRKAWDLL